jgi:methionine-rich copper-binding protein CopC
MNRSRLGRLVVSALLGVFASGVIATAAVAHTALTASTPSDGQTVAELDRVSLEFSGELLDIGASLTLVSEGAEPVELDVEHAAENRIEAAVPALDSGPHVLEWRVVAEDGHPIEGQIAFQIDAPAPAEPSPTPAVPSGQPTPTPSPAESTRADLGVNGDFGEKVSQNLTPLDALVIALVGAVLVGTAWLITRRVSAQELRDR